MRTFGFRTSVTTLVMLLGTIGTSAQAVADTVLDLTSAQSEHVSIASNSNLNITGSTVSLATWVKADSLADSNLILKGTTSTASTDLKYGIRIRNSGRVMMHIGQGGGNTLYCTTVNRLDTSSWHHIVATYDRDAFVDVNNSGIKIYIDGVSQSLSTCTAVGVPTIGHNAADVIEIGRYPSGIQYFDGRLDEVAVWNSALTAAEATAIYNNGNYIATLASDSGSYTSSANLKGYWRFNEGSGTTVADSSPSVANGTLINTPTWRTEDWLSPLVVSYDFEDNLNDSSPHANHGTAVGSLSYDANGKSGKSLILNGSSYVAMPTNIVASMHTQKYTASMWIKSDGGTGVLLGYQNGDLGTSSSSFTPLLGVQLDGRLRAEVYSGNSATDVTSHGVVNDNRWHHVALVVDDSGSDSYTLYLDGKLVGTFSGALGDASTQVVNQLGAGDSRGAGRTDYAQADPDNFTGQIDEFRIYNHDIYQPLANYTFESSANDVSGSHNHATEENTVAYDASIATDHTLNLAGAGDVALPANMLLNSGANFSVKMRIKTTATDDGLLGQQDVVTGGSPTYYVPLLYINGSGQAVMGIWNSTDGVNSVTSSAAVNDDSWHELIAVYEAGNNRLYVDGQLQGLSAITHAHGTMQYHQLGTVYSSTGWGMASSAWYPYAGLMDDVVVYDYSLAHSVAARAEQTISLTPLADKSLKTASVSLTVSSDSGLAVNVISTTPKVCSATSSTVSFISAGYCGLRVEQNGNQIYAPATPVETGFYVYDTKPVFINTSTVLSQYATDITTTANPRGIDAMDVDQDGDIDIVSTSWTGDSLEYHQNNGDGTFSSSVVFTSTGIISGVKAGDINGDGWPDLVFTTTTSGFVVYRLNNKEATGSVTFGTHTNIASGFTTPRQLDLADIDHDGDLDLFVTSSDGDVVAWWTNNGAATPTFTRQTNIDSGGNVNGAWEVIAADRDGDGDIDLLVTASVAADVVWYVNDGAQNFSRSVVEANLPGVFSAYPADLDNDGDIDVIAGSREAGLVNEVYWYENDGKNNYTRHLIVDGQNIVFHVIAADIDQDGDNDVAFTTESSLATYMNNGSGSFTMGSVIPNNMERIAVADLSGDNYPELIVSDVTVDKLLLRSLTYSKSVSV